MVAAEVTTREQLPEILHHLAARKRRRGLGNPREAGLIGLETATVHLVVNTGYAANSAVSTLARRRV